MLRSLAISYTRRSRSKVRACMRGGFSGNGSKSQGFCEQTRSKKVLEKLATSEKATIVIERQPDGKMRVTSGSWDGEKVFFPDQVLNGRRPDQLRQSASRRADLWIGRDNGIVDDEADRDPQALQAYLFRRTRLQNLLPSLTMQAGTYIDQCLVYIASCARVQLHWRLGQGADHAPHGARRGGLG